MAKFEWLNSRKAKVTLHNGRTYITEVLKNLPKGWEIIESSLTAPIGYKWADNGQPLFIKQGTSRAYNNAFKYALIKVGNKS